MDKPDWFNEWADKHFELFPRSDWPDFDTLFWAELCRMFEAMHVRPEVLLEASRRLFQNPPEFAADHPVALRTMIRRIWSESDVTSPMIPPAQFRAWDRAAALHWEKLPETEREDWRQKVRDGVPPFATQAGVLEKMAQGWAYDPNMVVLPPTPEQAERIKRGPMGAYAIPVSMEETR